jgi:hypothetical protein
VEGLETRVGCIRFTVGRDAGAIAPSAPTGARSDRVLPIGPEGVEPVRDPGAAVARHPDPLALDATVQLPAPAVLLQEGVERGEQLGHGAEG